MSAVVELDLQPTYSVVLALQGDAGTVTVTTDDAALEAVLMPALRGPAGTAGNYGDAITPTGNVDGANAVFTLPDAPTPAASLQLFRNGVLQRAGGVDYTLAALTITYTTAPSVGDSHVAWYRH